MMIRTDQPKLVSALPVVLAVDDDQAALEWIAMVLKKYEVLTTTNGAEALDIVRSRRVDCVLLDLRMPGIDGRQVRSQINAFDPHLDVILPTGVVQAPGTARATERGGLHVVGGW